MTDILHQDASQVDVRLYRGLAFSKLGRWQHALKDLKLVCQAKPSSTVGFYEKGCILRRIEPWQCIQDLSTCLLLSNEPHLLKDIYTQRAVTYYEMKEAIDSFGRALTNAFHPTTALSHSAFALFKAKKYEAAVKRMKNVLESGNVDSYSRFLLGKYLFEVGDFQEAKKAIRSVASVNPGSMGDHTKHHVLLLSFLGEHRQAAAMFHALCLTKPSMGRFLTLGKYQMKAKMYRQAIHTFSAILHQSPAVCFKELYLPLTGVSFKMSNVVQ
ncbi:unnamed protein product [Dibothriocephalus latus]|uniref:Uncharacterized protein n=1 Tax=Dibothriocephalus latus TaxID=60516 RepID=A0A3P7LRL6_DIBLA|nr:unnamed protein product [Dibothriocephalus latus]